MKREILRKGFLIIETVLFILFVAMDLFHTDSSYLKYIGIILCLLYSLAIRNTEGSIAFLFTLFADYFLLLRNDSYLLGVLSFIIVQLIYTFILFHRGCHLLLPIRVILLAGALLILYLLKMFDLLNVAALFYFSLLLGNFISSLTNKENRTLSAGLFLFLCCDICVGLFNLIQSGPVYAFASVMMWVFYLPSQIFLALGQDDAFLNLLLRKKQV